MEFIMKKLLIATAVGLVITTLVGCAQKSVVRYGDATAVETTDINFGSTDLQKVAGDMTDSLLLSPVVGKAEKFATSRISDTDPGKY